MSGTAPAPAKPLSIGDELRYISRDGSEQYVLKLTRIETAHVLCEIVGKKVNIVGVEYPAMKWIEIGEIRSKGTYTIERRADS